MTEKLDGGNTCLHKGKVYARSTGQTATEKWFDFVKADHAPRTYDVDEYVYGENLYAVHSIKYDPLPDFYHVFGVLKDGVFVSWDDLTAFSRSCGFATVPLIHRGVFDSVQAITKFLAARIGERSVYGPEREGFVIRVTDAIPYENFSEYAAKYVRANHVKTDVHWTKTWYPAKLKTEA